MSPGSAKFFVLSYLLSCVLGAELGSLLKVEFPEDIGASAGKQIGCWESQGRLETYSWVLVTAVERKLRAVIC